MEEENPFEILICAYGNYPQLISRLINSILNNSDNKNKIHVGLNEGGLGSKAFLRNLIDNGKIASLIEVNPNIHKDRMMRKLIDCVNKDHFIWFDDDCYITRKGWDTEVINYMKQNPLFDIAGFPHMSHRLVWPYNDPSYHEFLHQRPWYKGIIQPNESECLFPVGGTWIARVEYLRKYDFPDRGMYLRWHQHRDDMLMGDFIKETGGQFDVLFGWDDLFKVNKADRRGSKNPNV